MTAVAEAVAATDQTTLSCVELLLEYLKREGVDTVFALPGGPLTPVLDGLYREPAIRRSLFVATPTERVSGRWNAARPSRSTVSNPRVERCSGRQTRA